MMRSVCSGERKCWKVWGRCGERIIMMVLLRGSNKLMLEEADRSLHDALCVLR